MLTLRMKTIALASKLYSLLVMLCLLSCSDLNVKVSGKLTRDPVLDIPALSDDGHFLLRLKDASSDSPYDLYRLKVEILPESFQNLPLQTSGALSYALLETVDKKKRASLDASLSTLEKIGTIKKDEVFTLREEIDPSFYYIFAIRLKDPPASHLVSQVKIEDVSAVFGKTSDAGLEITWPEVDSASSYEITFQKPVRDPLVTDQNTFVLEPYDDSQDYEFCVRARAGSLQSPTCKAYTKVATASRVKAIDVKSSQGSGLYMAQTSLEFTVTFSEIVHVDGEFPPALLMQVGDQTRNAQYSGGTGTSALNFIFDIVPGLNTSELEALRLLDFSRTGSIKDAKGIKASFAIPMTGSGNSLADQFDIAIDTEAPTPPYSIGFPGNPLAVLSFPVSFSESTDLNFKEHEIKLCQNRDCATSCTLSVSQALSPVTLVASDATEVYACVRGIDIVGNMTAWVPSQDSVLVDTSLATVNGVTASTADGIYKAGSLITLEVEFTSAVVVKNPLDVTLKLSTGGAGKNARYVSGSGTDTLVFEYTVEAGDTSSDLNYASISALQVGSTGSLETTMAGAVSLLLPPVGAATSLATQKNIVIDTTPPTPPTSLGFGSSISSDVNLSLSFVPGTDTHFQTHDFKLCEANDCLSACLAVSQQALSPEVLSGLTAKSYYGCGRSLDTAGNTSAWVSTLNPISIDTTAPTVVTVSSSSPSTQKFFRAGGMIPIHVTFSENVFVTGSGLSFLLETGATDTSASYVSGSGSSTLVFQYTVAAGDTSLDLEAESTLAITLGGAFIKDAAGVDADRTLPVLGGVASLSGQREFVIDTTAPTVASNIQTTSDLSQTLDNLVTFTPSTDAHFTEHRLKFCSANDCLSACVGEMVKDTSPALMNAPYGGSFYICVRGEDRAGNSSPWAIKATPLIIDTTGPAITQVSSSKSNGDYKLGELIDISITFQENVFVTNSGDLGLSLETGTIDQTAQYLSGNGTTTLVFRYEVQSGDTSPDLEVLSINALVLGATGQIKDAAGNSAILTLPTLGGPNSLSGTKNLIIDTTSPSSPTVTPFAETVSKQSLVSVVFTAGLDTNLRHHRTKICSASDCDQNCTAIASGVSPQDHTGLNGQSYFACVQAEDRAGNLSPWVSSPQALTIDLTAPLLQNVSSPSADSSYKAGALIDITLTYDEPVFVTGGASITLGLDHGAPSERALYSTGSGSRILHFRYEVKAGENSADLEVSSTTPLSLGVGTIRDAAGNDSVNTAALTGGNSLSGQKALVIDTTSPLPPSAITLSTALTGNPIVPVTFTSGNDTYLSTHQTRLCSTSDCETSCTPFIEGLSSPQNVTLEVDGSYYACVRAKDEAGNLSLWTASLSSIRLDRTPARVISVGSQTANGVYKTGDLVDVRVHFDRNVTLTGTDIAIQLETGATDQWATYVGGSGTSTLIFEYAVQASDVSSDLNYLSTNALLLNSGTVEDDIGNSVTLTLPPLSANESLASQTALIIASDVPPDPVSVGFSGATSNSNQLTVAWNGGAQGIHFKEYEVKLCTAPACGTCEVEVSTAVSPLVMTASSSGSYYACVRAMNKNNLSSQWVSSVTTATIDQIPPTVQTVSTTKADGVYGSGRVEIDVEFDENVYLKDQGLLRLALNIAGREATYVSGNGTTTLRFEYLIQEGDNTSLLDVSGANALSFSAPSGEAKDAAGNDADLTLTANFAVDHALAIDTTKPTAPSSLGWSSPASSSLSNDFAFAPGVDTHLSHYETKACSSSFCDTSCTATSTTPASPATVVGTAGTTYYACARSVDEAGWTSEWVSSINPLTIDQTIPEVLSVTSSLADGIYPPGTVIDIDVKFSEALAITNGAQLTLTVDLGAPFAVPYFSLNSDTLRFRFTTLGGHETSDLEVVSINALALGTGLIEDLAGNTADIELPPLGDPTSLSGSRSIAIDSTSPTVPTNVRFAGTYSANESFPLLWDPATDSHMSHYEAKLCYAADCGTCRPVTETQQSPANLEGLRSESYYGCVRSVDRVNLKSAWVPTSRAILVLTRPVFFGASNGEIIGSFDDGQAKLDLTFNWSPGSGEILAYEVFFTDSGDPTSVDYEQPIARINVGDSLYDSDPNDYKLQVPIPLSELKDGYYAVRYISHAEIPLDDNISLTPIIHVLKDHPNYQLIPRKFSGLAYDYFLAKYEGSADGLGTIGTDTITTNAAQIAQCNYAFHRSGTAFDASCGTKTTSMAMLSEPLATPETGLSFDQAFTMCRNSSTAGALLRLPTYEEWMRASRMIESTYTSIETIYETGTGSACNISGTALTTGERSACRSALGLYDMAGNNAEMVDSRMLPYNVNTLGLGRFALAGKEPIFGREIANGIDNTRQTLDERTPPAEGLVITVGGSVSSGPRGPGEASWQSTSDTTATRVAARCVGFLATHMPTMTQLSLPDEPKYSSNDYAGAPSTWTIPENKFAGQNAAETLSITVNGNTSDNVAEGSITLSWKPWSKKVCNPTCYDTDNGFVYKIYRFLEPNRSSIRHGIPWALGGAGSVYASDKPLDPLAVDEDFAPLYSSSTTDGRLIATLTQCNAGRQDLCTFQDSTSAGTLFDPERLYSYLLVVTDREGNSIYPKVRRHRGQYQIGSTSVATRYEPRYRKAGVFLVDEAYQLSKAVPQVMSHVPMNKSGMSYDYFIQKYEASYSSGMITPDAAASDWPLTHSGGTWLASAGECEDRFLKTGLLDVSACGNGTRVHNTMAVLSSRTGQNASTGFDQGAFWKACRNSSFSDSDGKIFNLRLATDTQWFKAAEWGDMDQDGEIDQNPSLTGQLILDLEEGAADTITPRCHTDNLPAALYPAGDPLTASCLSRYGVRDMVGNASEWTSRKVTSFDRYADDGVDGFQNFDAVVDPTLTVFSLTWDLSTGRARDGDFANPFSANDLYAYTLGGGNKSVRRGGRYSLATSGRFTLDISQGSNASDAFTGGRCSFSQ